MDQSISSLTRRRFLASAAGGSVGWGLLGQRSPSPAVARATKSSARARADWPQYQGDAGNTGYSPRGTAPARNLTLEWQANVDGLSGAPAVTNQTVYAPVFTETPGDETPPRHTLLALDATDGSVTWRAEMEGESSVAVIDGTVYLADGPTRALDAADGSERWATPRGSYHPVVTDRFVYVTEGVEECLALDRMDGSITWRSAFRATQIPAVDGDTVYAGAEDGSVHALAATTGTRRWTQPLDDTNPDLVAADGMAYAAAVSGLYALDGASGDVQWMIPSQRPPESSYRTNVSLPVIANGTVYVAVDGVLRAVSAATGNEKWTYESAADTPLIPPACVGDVIYYVDAPNRVVALNTATGTRLGTYTVPFNGLDRVIVPANGAIYVSGEAWQRDASNDSGLFKIGGQPL